MQIYLAAVPNSAHAVRGCQPARVAYRIGEGSSLLSLPLPGELRGGLLSLSDRDAPPVDDPQRLAEAIFRECTRRSYSGVLLDAESPVREDLRSAAAAAIHLLSRRRLPLFAPAEMRVSQAIPLFCTAISGGTLQQYLREIAARGTFALDVQRLCMDFSLPCPSGQGTPLTARRFAELQRAFPARVFFSPELCAKYFTYCQGEQWHLVLFDDRETLQKKLTLAESLNCRAAFFMWPEVADLLPGGF